MSICDLIIVAVAAIGLAIWIRGCSKTSGSDCVLAIVLGIIASTVYFFFFSLTRTAYLATIIFGAFFLALLPFGRVLRTRFGRIFAIIVISLATVAAITEHKFVSAGNALLVIEPYHTGKGWAFDEPRLGLKGEPFVLGIPEMIDKLAAGIPGADKSIRLIFSQHPFPGALRLDRRREENGGNWYYSENYDMEGWLCPALFKFFPRAPQHIYAKAEPR
jgi:hypothetical protein